MKIKPRCCSVNFQHGFEGGSVVQTVGPDIYSDEAKRQEANFPPMTGVLCLLLSWAKNSRAKVAVIGKLLAMDERPLNQIANQARVHRQAIRRAFISGKAFMLVELSPQARR
jgi:hypothetical protein